MPEYGFAALLVVVMGLTLLAGIVAASMAANIPNIGYVPLVPFVAMSVGLIAAVAATVGVNMYVFSSHPQWWAHGAIMQWVDGIAGILMGVFVLAALVPLTKVKRARMR